MNKTYFIADLHLSDDTSLINQGFFSFLENLKQNANSVDALYILGDFFEAWIGDDNHTALNQQVANELNQLSQAGVKLYFTHGNRDFLIKREYANACGMTLLPEQTVFDLYGTPTLDCHGDELCTDDIEYQKFRKKSRSWWWQTLMLNLPLSFRQKKAAKIRAHSNQSKKMKSQAIMDVNERAVSDMFIKFNVSQMIHGHTHRPNVHKYDKNKTRYVLGDWYTDLWYIEASHEGLELIKEPL